MFDQAEYVEVAAQIIVKPVPYVMQDTKLFGLAAWDNMQLRCIHTAKEPFKI